ncbi:unnamed protein product, partial [marine sediment metagenome]
DMLTEYLKMCDPLDVKVAIIDEAQDLNDLQWSVVNHAFKNTKHHYIAGDDDQAIYKWSGAAVNTFLNLGKQMDTVEVLEKSHRLPEPVFNYANRVTERIKNRYGKTWSHADHDGAVNIEREHFHLDFSEDSWYILARNHYFLDKFKTLLKKQGVLYSSGGKKSVSSRVINAILDYERFKTEPDLRLPGKRVERILGYLGIRHGLLKSTKKYSLLDWYKP